MHAHFLTRLTAASLLCMGTAYADVLISQGPASHTVDSNFIQADVFGSAANSGFQNADSFTLSGNALVTGFGWYGSPVQNTDDFIVRIFSSPSDAPTDLTGTTTATGTGNIDNFNEEVFEYQFSISGSPLALGAGTHYLSVLFNADVTNDFWYWLASDTGDGTSLFRGVDGDPWNSLPPDLSLSVIGELPTANIPEPGTLALLAGAALAGLARRRTA